VRIFGGILVKTGFRLGTGRRRFLPTTQIRGGWSRREFRDGFSKTHHLFIYITSLPYDEVAKKLAEDDSAALRDYLPAHRCHMAR
jgi:hypothetical protein